MPVTGVQATGAIGDVIVGLGVNIFVTGVAATGEIGTVHIWSQIVRGKTRTGKILVMHKTQIGLI